MKARLFKIYFLLVCMSGPANADSGIKYPEGYRYWPHVKSLTLHAGHPLENPFKGIHHIYANKSGVKGIKSGKYEDGATIVFDLLENHTANNASSEGRRVLIGVMVKNHSKYKTTGGWGFEAWPGDERIKRLTNDGGKSCFGCHTSQKKNDFVFSKWRK